MCICSGNVQEISASSRELSEELKSGRMPTFEPSARGPLVDLRALHLRIPINRS